MFFSSIKAHHVDTNQSVIIKKMKSFILVVTLFLIASPIKAQTRPPCRNACITLYDPVCGETLIEGKVLRCEFGNSCFMGVSSCAHRISKFATTNIKKIFNNF